MTRRIFVFLVLFGFWIVLSGNLDAAHLTMGLISCALVTWFSGDLMFQQTDSTAGKFLGQGWRMLTYIPWLTKEIVVANFHVLRLALSPGGIKDVEPQIIAHKTYLKGEFARFLFANSVTLTPGTITMEMHGDTIYIHAISNVTAAGLQGPMEDKIAKIFGEEKPA